MPAYAAAVLAWPARVMRRCPRRGGARRPRPAPLRLRPRPRARGPARRRRAARRGLGRRRGPRGGPRGRRGAACASTTSLARGFPAGPPGRLRFALDIPKGARLQLACAIDPRYHERPGRRVRGEGEAGRPRGRRLVAAPRPDRAPRAPRAGCRWTSTSRSYAGRGRELVLETRGYEQAGDPERAFWGTPAITVAPQGAARDRLPRGHAAGRPHRRLRLRAQDDPRARRLREGRGRLRRGGRARLVDEAVGGLDPHVAAARRSTARCSCATRSTPRTSTIAQRLDERGWATGAAIANSVDLRRRVGVRPRLRRLRRAARRGRPAEQARGRRRRGGLGPRLPALAAGPAHLPLRAHDGPARPLRAAPALRPDVRAPPDRGPPRARPAHRLQGAARPRAHDRAVRRRHRVRRPRVRPLRARAEGGGARTRTRSSSSSPTTARSSWTTAGGSTAAASSTSSSACRSS